MPTEGLREGWEEGRHAWPGIAVPEATLAAHVAAVLGPDAESPPTARIHFRDLYLACACVQRVEGALEAFEAAFFNEIDAVLARRRDLEMAPDDLRQIVRQKLFTSDEDAAPAIARYSGTGELRTWFRVLVSRVTSNLARTPSREQPVEDQALTFLLGSGEDEELANLKRRYREEFRQAFTEGLDELEARERNLLRLAFVDGLTVDAIGKIYGVHRATAARWVAAAHERLAERVRAALKSRLKVSTAEMESILRLIGSQVDITLERYLA